jgi:DNA-damage-inducible protein J
MTWLLLSVSQLRCIIGLQEVLTMPQSTMLHIRVEDEIKEQASEALAAMGLSMSDAVRILLKRVVSDQAFPLELKVPNAATRAAIKESRARMKAGKASFDTAQELINDLEKAGKQ